VSLKYGFSILGKLIQRPNIRKIATREQLNVLNSLLEDLKETTSNFMHTKYGTLTPMLEAESSDSPQKENKSFSSPTF